MLNTATMITVIGELLSGLILCMWSALTVSGKFLSILPDSDENRFRALLDELENLNLLPKCTCDNVCGNAILQAKNDNITKVSQFLMGLNPQFSAVRSQILLMPILPSLNEAYAPVTRGGTKAMCYVSH